MDNKAVVVRVERAATILNIPAHTVRRRIVAGLIPATRIGGQWMIPVRFLSDETASQRALPIFN